MDAELKVRNAEEALVVARKAVDEALLERDAILNEMAKTAPSHGLQDTISAYLASQNRMAGIE
jgi:hypothetical protein